MVKHLLLSAAALASAAYCATFPYTSVTLPPLASQPTATPVITSLNNKGQVAGFDYLSSGAETPVVWTHGVPSELAMPAGYALDVIYAPGGPYPTTGIPAINLSGQVLSQAKQTSTGDGVGILWTGGVPAIIGAAPNNCGSMSTTVAGLNAPGHVLGYSSGGSCTVYWIWENGTFLEFTPPGPGVFVPAGIEDADHVMGLACLPSSSGCGGGGFVVSLSPNGTARYPLADGISIPNNLDQVTGYILAGPGVDSLAWLSPNSLVGIPPSGRWSQQSFQYTNLNNSGYLVFVPFGAQNTYSIQHQSTVDGVITGVMPAGQILLQVNDGLQFIGSGYVANQVTLYSPAPGACAADVTSQITVVKGPISYNSSTQRFEQTVQLTNNGAALVAPVSLLLDNLSPAVSLYGLRGSTTCMAPAGVPFADAPASFGATGSVTQVQLQFLNTGHNSLSWTPRLLAGAGGR